MARPRQFDEATVKAALRDVFWQYGYDGASYADIMDATGLNKGSLYASFGDKRALYQHAIANYNQEFLSSGLTMLKDKTLSPKARIKALFDGVIAAAETPQGRWGCLLCNAATDQAPFDKEVEDVVEASFTRLKKAIKACIKDTPAEGKTELIWTAYAGGRVMIKAGYTRSVLRQQQKQILSLFDA